jgi:hypothetical protein
MFAKTMIKTLKRNVKPNLHSARSSFPARFHGCGKIENRSGKDGITALTQSVNLKTFATDGRIA